MADNVGYTPGTGATVAADEIGGVLFQRVKLTTGADGTADDVSPANPLPVSGTQDDGTASNGKAMVVAGITPGGVVQILETNGSGHLHVADGGGSITVDGTVAVSNFPATQAVSADSLPLPTGAATETTLAALNAKLLTSTEMPDQNAVSLPVRQSPMKYWIASFSDVGSGLRSPLFTQIGPTGTGMAISQSAGNLVITTGTTANQEITLRSIQSFSGALTLHGLIQLSQRIANNNFFVDLVDVIGDNLAFTIVNATTVDVTLTSHGYTDDNVGQRMDIGCITGAAGVPMEAVIASIPNANTIRFTVAGWPATGSGTCSLTGWNKIELLYTGTSATIVNFNTRRRGWQNTSVGAAINTTASGHIAAVNVANGLASLSDQVTTSLGSYTNRHAWRVNNPDPDVTLFLQLRARNGTTNPASNTTCTVRFVRVEDYIPTQVDIVGTRQQSIANSLPVFVTSQIVLTASGARVGFVAGSGIWFDDSATALAANATFTGTSRDLAATATATAISAATAYTKEMRLSAESDVAGTLWLEVSRDNTTWRRVKSVATAAVTGGGQYAEIVHRPSWRYARVGFTNGATIQARFSINSLLMAT